MKTNIHLYHISLFLLTIKNVSEKKVVKKIKTHILCSMIFVENCAVYEIILDNTAEPVRPQMPIGRMCTEWWITKATNTHSENVILTVFPLQQ
jgi:hypothetical protein